MRVELDCPCRASIVLVAEHTDSKALESQQERARIQHLAETWIAAHKDHQRAASGKGEAT